MSEPVVRRRDRSYAPTVLLGLAAASLLAVAGTREWARGHGFAAGIRVEAVATGADVAPLVGALGLVALAAWGVVLVTRSRVRRAVAGIGLLSSLGATAAVLAGLGDAEQTVTAALVQKGASADVLVSSTGWGYVAGLAAVLTAVAFTAGVLRASRWPAMGSKYDAPAARAEQPLTEQDLWRALDEGHDPTS